MNEATAGAALKYHIKRALERSHSISDFSKQLELSAQNSKFTNNTLKIIEELNNGVKQASEELKEKVTKYEKALKELQKIDESKLTKEQKQVLKVFKGELDQAEIKGIDLNDLYYLEQGTKKAGAKKILIKHYGVENTGGLTNDELLNMGEVIKNGSVLLESFEKRNNGVRYAYEWDNNGVKLRLVIDDLNDGNKIFDFYSDRNFTDFRDVRPQPNTSKDSGPLPTTLNEPNLTQKPLDLSRDLLKTQENPLNSQDLSPLEQAKERTNELLKEIPNILQKGFKEEDRPGYAIITLNNSKVILSKFKGDNELKNHYMITSFEVDEKVLRELDTIATLSNDYRDGINYSISNLNELNLTRKPLTSQEDLLKTQETTQKTAQEPLSEQAKAEKLAKLESEKLESEKEFLTSYQIFFKSFSKKRKVTLQIKLIRPKALKPIGQPKRAS
ncbi:hypothetical protein HPAKL117_05225 [Helicobacter pylori Aklavik117]|nr:hypothetical protein HPAKL117_05225 [Helicobacter pylori Aklavik117]